MSPSLFTLLLITLSTIYLYKYMRVVTMALSSFQNVPLPRDKAKADIYVAKIRETIRSIRTTSKAKRELLLVISFFDNIDDENYRKSRKFLDSNRNIVTEQELEELRMKIETADQ